MDKFSTLTTGAVALEADNIDTDQIMPKQFLRGIDKAGLDKGLFYNLKHKADGSLNPDCVLNSSAAACTIFPASNSSPPAPCLAPSTIAACAASTALSAVPVAAMSIPAFAA